MKSSKGISSLPMVLILGGIIVTFAIGATLLIFLLNSANLGERLGGEALSAARSGIDDAILRVIRDKNCPDASCPAAYNFAVDNRTVEITICKDSCDGVGRHTLTAVGSALTNRKKIKAILEVNAVTGAVTVESIKETAL